MSASQQSLLSVLDRMQIESHASRLNVARPSPPKYGGKTYNAKLDERRLNAISKRIFDLMKDGVWRTQSEIRDALKLHPDCAITSRIRDFRKVEFGAHEVPEPRRRGDPRRGSFEYRLIVRELSCERESISVD